MEPTTLYGLIALVVSNIGMWIRELKKHKTWKTQNGDVLEIKGDVKSLTKKVDCIDRKVVEVRTEVDSFKETCKRINGEVAQNRKDILDLAKEMVTKSKG